MPQRKPTYLGDGTYASPGRFDGEVILTTGHHERDLATNVIYLDPEVLAQLQAWLAVEPDPQQRDST
jgi:hypothetical protein